MATHVFLIKHNYEHRSSIFAEYQLPNVVGFFSIDQNRQFDPSTKNVRYLYRPSLQNRLDLNIGFNEFKMRGETLENEEKINFILRWLIYRNYLKALVEDSKPIFISYRGILTTIMKTPYERNDGWIIIATKIKNLIFFCEFWTDEKKRKVVAGISRNEKLCIYWGRKFEQYLLSSDPLKEPDCSSPVTDFEEFIVMYGRQLNRHYVLFGAETDAVISDVPIDLELNLNSVKSSKFVELKTSVIVPNLTVNYFKNFKLLKWWSQSFIVGIENIVCGIREKKGMVRELRDVKVNELPNRSKMWKPSVCVGVLDDFLSFVKDIMIQETDLTHWKFSWNPNSPSIRAQKLENARPTMILPIWFVDECKKLNIVSK